MSESTYPPVTRDLAERRRALAPELEDAFRTFSQKVFADGALPAKTKELLGLVASAVLRCNDCIDYHLEQCVRLGYSREEIIDALNVALVVGGSIFIPHFRHAVQSLDELLHERDEMSKV